MCTAEESVLISEVRVLISEVEFYTNMAFGIGKGVLFIKVSLFQGVLISEIKVHKHGTLDMYPAY